MDAEALEDSDDENISNAFKGKMLRPENMRGGRSQKMGKNDESDAVDRTYDPRVKEFNVNYLQNR